MDKNEIVKIIENLDEENPIKIFKDKKFTNELVANLENLNDIDLNKIKTLMCGNSKYSTFLYNQGIAELFIYFLLNKQNITFCTEENENNSNSSNVDVSFEFKDIKFNIEVKSPEYNLPSENKLSGSFANRFGNKKDNYLMMKNFSEKLKKNITGTKYEDVETLNLTDNKVKDCLLSAQNKFAEPTKTNFNILFLCTTTEEMESYWQYIVNPNSGFFNENSDVSSFFADKNQTIQLKKEMYNKVSAIVLSNAITLNERRTEQSWNIDNAITLVLANPFSNYKNMDQYRILDSFFKNNTFDFCNGLCKFEKENPGTPDIIYFYEFVSSKDYDVNEEKKINKE